jgi:hypothetical protein
LGYPKIIEFLGSKEWDEIEKDDSNRNTIYFNWDRYDERFTYCFPDVPSKVTLSKDKHGQGDAGVNFILRFGAQFGVDRGQTIEFDLGNIPQPKKAQYVEDYLNSNGKLLDPFNVDPFNALLQSTQPLYKTVGKSIFPLKVDEIYNEVDEEKGKVIYDEFCRQEDNYRDFSADGGVYRYLWKCLSEDRTVAAAVRHDKKR